jgi:hypothetical protein
MRKTLALAFCVYAQIVFCQSVDEPINRLFPIYGITLGGTAVEEMIDRGCSCYKNADIGSGYFCEFRGITFRDEDDNGILESIDFDANEMPYKWETYFGFDFNQSYESWKSLLEKLGFTVDIIKAPTTEFYVNRKVFSAAIRATSKSQRTTLEFDFNFGNEYEEGSTSESLRSLYAIWVSSEEVDEDVYTANVKNDSLEEKEGIFPIYNFTLGKTTVKTIKERGFPCKKDGGTTVCYVKKLSFWDFDGDQILERITFFPDGEMPHKWETYFGFDPEQSYESWIAQLGDHKFDIEVVEEPAIEVYEGRDTFVAQMKATSERYGVTLRLDFRYGNGNQEGATAQSSRSLYMITFELPGAGEESKGD